MNKYKSRESIFKKAGGKFRTKQIKGVFQLQWNLGGQKKKKNQTLRGKANVIKDRI